MKRRELLRDFGLGGAAMASGMLTSAIAHAKDDRVPPGEPFQALQHQINALEEGEFDQLTVQTTIFFGQTNSLCSIGIDREGPSGLLLRDPDGIRILNPEAGAGARTLNPTPTLLFGPTDDCRIELGVANEGLIVLDPYGLNIQSPLADSASVLSFGPPGDAGSSPCAISAAAGVGMIFEDPDGFQFSSPAGLNIQNPTQANPNQPSSEQALEDLNAPAILSFGPRDPETGSSPCLISAAAGVGMIFEDPDGFQFTSGVDEFGIVTAQKFVEVSSARLKENVRGIEAPLDKLKALRGVRFDWKAGNSRKADIGFIAEEVDAVLPELVIKKPGDDAATGVAYANIVAVAVEGIKAQQDTIEQLETEKSRLREEVERLSAQLEAVARQVQNLVAAAG